MAIFLIFFQKGDRTSNRDALPKQVNRRNLIHTIFRKGFDAGGFDE